MNKEEKVLKYIYDFFVNSFDFNGVSIRELSEKLKFDFILTIKILENLVKNNFVSVQEGKNPNIISLCNHNLDTQLVILNNAKNSKKTIEKFDFFESSIDFCSETYNVCVYPSQSYLIQNRNLSIFSFLPYSKDLAIGEPHLKPIFFNLDVLEKYNNDPRFRFKFDDYSGNICYEDEDNLDDKDKIFLESFGLGLDKEKNRVVVVYLSYLNKLNTEHQLYWKSKEIIQDGCAPLNEYYINTIGGKPTNCISIYNAVLNEQMTINQLCKNAFDKPFFRKEFSRYDKPQEFNTILFPTMRNYYEFILTAEKLFVDNIDKEFFKGQIDLTKIEKQKDDTIKKTDKGTISLFEEWIRLNHSIASEVGFNERFFKPFKKIRQERQNPAHKIMRNDFKKEYKKFQNLIMGQLYDSLHIFRQILQRHPKNIDFQIDKWLDNSEVKIY